MCVPCVAPAASALWPLIIGILIFLGALLYVIGRMIPPIGMFLGVLLLGLSRFVTGAIVFKDFGQTDEDAWARHVREGGKGPRVTRPVRATIRLSLVAAGVGLVLNPLAVALTVGSLSVLASGTAIYTRRDAIRAKLVKELPSGQPVKVKAEIGSGR